MPKPLSYSRLSEDRLFSFFPSTFGAKIGGIKQFNLWPLRIFLLSRSLFFVEPAANNCVFVGLGAMVFRANAEGTDKNAVVFAWNARNTQSSFLIFCTPGSGKNALGTQKIRRRRGTLVKQNKTTTIGIYAS